MQLQEQRQQMTSEISDLHSFLQSSHSDQLTQICAKVDAMDSKLTSVSSTINDTIDNRAMFANSELETNILTNVTKQLNKISGFSYVSPTCGGAGWTRVAYLDMTDPNTICPPGWQIYIRDSKRTCGRISTGHQTCDSVIFPVDGKAYSCVCGRLKAYQSYAFRYMYGRATIDEAYVDGVSLTHGSPRQHIWTFAAGGSESKPTSVSSCPCDATISISINVSQELIQVSIVALTQMIIVIASHHYA